MGELSNFFQKSLNPYPVAHRSLPHPLESQGNTTK